MLKHQQRTQLLACWHQYSMSDRAIWHEMRLMWAHVQSTSAYQKLRIERTNQRLVGVRAKRAAEAAAEEKDKAK